MSSVVTKHIAGALLEATTQPYRRNLMNHLIRCKILRRICKVVTNAQGRQCREATDNLKIICKESAYCGRVFNQNDSASVDRHLGFLAENTIIWRRGAGWQTASQFKPSKKALSRIQPNKVPVPHDRVLESGSWVHIPLSDKARDMHRWGLEEAAMTGSMDIESDTDFEMEEYFRVKTPCCLLHEEPCTRCLLSATQEDTWSWDLINQDDW